MWPTGIPFILAFQLTFQVKLLLWWHNSQVHSGTTSYTFCKFINVQLSCSHVCTDFSTITQCTGIHKIMLWVNIQGHLYDARWQPMMAIKLSKEWGDLAFLHYSYVADVSRSLMVRGVQLAWSGTKINCFYESK